MAAYRWQPGSDAGHELRRIAQQQIDRGLGELDDDDRHRAVHQVRKRGKKVRALLRLVRHRAPELYQRENAAFRDATRPLSDHRDAAVAVETYDQLLTRYGDDVVPAELAPVREALVERRRGVLGDDLDARLAGVRTDLEAARARLEAWDLDGDGFDVVAGGLAKTYGRARDRMEDAYGDATSAAFHLWRKRVKYHRYHVRLLQDVWPEVMKARREQLHELTDLLGDDHDLAVLRHDLVTTPERYGGAELLAPLCGLLDRRRAELQAAARPLGLRCFVEPTGRFVERVGSYWDALDVEPQQAALADATVPAGR